MKDYTIKFEFIGQRFNYSLPMLVNNERPSKEFLSERKKEILSCMEQLATRVSEINIASAKGLADFGLANQLVRHYFYALMTVNSYFEMTYGEKAEKSEEEKEAYSVYMHNQTRERTR